METQNLSFESGIEEREVTLGEIWGAIRAKARLIMLLGLLTAIAGGGASFLVTPKYSAEVLLMPVSRSESTGGAGSMTSQFAGLAELAGVNVLGTGSEKQEALATLESRKLTDAFIRDHDLLSVFFSSKWDDGAGRWKGSDEKRNPTIWDGTRYFDREVRTVAVDKKSGLVTMSILWIDPDVAASWANELIVRTNTLLREKAISEANSNLQFLQQQLDKTAIIEVRQSIYRLMENQIKTLTLAEGATEYALKVIDPAVAPHKRSSPDRLLFLLGGLVLGLICGMIYALLAAPTAGAKFA